MDKIFVDSGVWIAAFHERDDHHKQGMEFIKWFDKQTNYSIIITNLVLGEVLNHLQRKTNPQLMRKIAYNLVNHDKIELYYDEGDYQEQTFQILNKIESLSYVDSSIVVFYKLFNCKYLISYDNNFNRIERLIKIEDPPYFD